MCHLYFEPLALSVLVLMVYMLVVGYVLRVQRGYLSLNTIDLNTLSHQELHSAKTGEAFSLSAVLSDGLALQKLFIHHDIVPPGRRASRPHFHSEIEEVVFVLEGEVVASLGDEERVLAVGEVIAFPPGPENIHCIRNDTSKDAKILVVASTPEGDEIHYG